MVKVIDDTEFSTKVFSFFLEKLDLKSDYKVLEVGSGRGRLAFPFTNFLKNGHYYGLDINKKDIDESYEKIGKQHSNFHFILADIYSRKYNPEGKQKASDYKFPFVDNFFDFVFLHSVFTHMLPKDVENYLSEITRVLKKGHICHITYLLLNEKSKLENKESYKYRLQYKFDNYVTINKNQHEDAIGLYENYIRELYEKYNLKIQEPIIYGNWTGKKNALLNQDIVLAIKT